MHKVSEVFVPGGMPHLTYVKRLNGDLEQQLTLIKEGNNKMVVVTGPTKTGKTVLVKRVFPPEEGCVWIDGGAVRDENDFWLSILDILAEPIEQSVTEDEALETTVEGSASASAGIVLAKGSVTSTASITGKNGASVRKNFRGSPRQRALNALKTQHRALVIDDFHYITRETQRAIVQALKSIVFDGLPVIAIAIPHRGFDPLKVEREMTGRLTRLDIPTWTEQELKEIPQTGFPLLRVNVTTQTVQNMYTESNNSPHLVQDFCRTACQLAGIKETLSERDVTISVPMQEIYESLAQGTGRTVYEQLKRGPRQRGRERQRRRLLSGGDTDIYGVILLALSRLKPGMAKIEYSDVLRALKDLVHSEDIPRAEEVSRVFDQMSKIASADGVSVSVLDWEKEDRVLHVTDPFFAFFLKWGQPGAIV